MKSEVKGVWFATARRFVRERYGPEAHEAIAAAVDAEHHDTIADPLASEWYPEEALQQGMAAMGRVLAHGDSERLGLALEACTDLGINHFFRALLRLGSPAMVLRKVPTMWSLIRRGDAVVTAAADDEQATIRYENFPYFYDANYRLMTLASLRTVVRICAGRVPRLDIVSYERDALSVQVVYDATSVPRSRRDSTPP